MLTRGIRGAITVEDNTPEAIKIATIKLLKAIINSNNFEQKDISHVLFTLTADLNADFPAKYARLDLNWVNVPMMCYIELDVPKSLRKCLRVLVVVNCNEAFQPNFVYLDGAEGLRK